MKKVGMMFYLLLILITTLSAQEKKTTEKPRHLFLWKVEGYKSVYLFGSLDSPNPPKKDLSPKIWKTLGSCKTLLFGAPEANRKEWSKLLFLSKEKSLQKLVDSKTWTTFRKTCYNIPEKTAKKMTPFCAITVYKKIRYPIFQVEKSFQEKALESEQSIKYLDQDDSHLLKALKQVSQATYIKVLKSIVRSHKLISKEEEELLNAYKNGNEKLFLKLQKNSQLEKRIPTPWAIEQEQKKKIRRWLPKIETYFQKGSVFISLKLSNWIGKDGLLEKLRKRGHKITPVYGTGGILARSKYRVLPYQDIFSIEIPHFFSKIKTIGGGFLYQNQDQNLSFVGALQRKDIVNMSEKDLAKAYLKQMNIPKNTTIKKKHKQIGSYPMDIYEWDVKANDTYVVFRFVIMNTPRYYARFLLSGLKIQEQKNERWFNHVLKTFKILPKSSVLQYKTFQFENMFSVKIPTFLFKTEEGSKNKTFFNVSFGNDTTGHSLVVGIQKKSNLKKSHSDIKSYSNSYLKLVGALKNSTLRKESKSIGSHLVNIFKWNIKERGKLFSYQLAIVDTPKYYGVILRKDQKKKERKKEIWFDELIKSFKILPVKIRYRRFQYNNISSIRIPTFFPSPTRGNNDVQFLNGFYDLVLSLEMVQKSTLKKGITSLKYGIRYVEAFRGLKNPTLKKMTKKIGFYRVNIWKWDDKKTTKDKIVAWQLIVIDTPKYYCKMLVIGFKQDQKENEIWIQKTLKSFKILQK